MRPRGWPRLRRVTCTHRSRPDSALPRGSRGRLPRRESVLRFASRVEVVDGASAVPRAGACPSASGRLVWFRAPVAQAGRGGGPKKRNFAARFSEGENDSKEPMSAVTTRNLPQGQASGGAERQLCFAEPGERVVHDGTPRRAKLTFRSEIAPYLRHVARRHC